MVQAKRFLFEYCFDSSESSEKQMGEAPRSTEAAATEDEPSDRFSKDDLAQARAEGFAEGREQAKADSSISVESQLARALDAFGNRVTELITHHAETSSRVASYATLAAMAVARKMIPELYRRNAVREIELAVAEIFDRIPEKPTLNLRVNEVFRDDLSTRIDALVEQRGFAGQVTVAPDPHLDECDCRIEWAGGGAELMFAALWRDVDEIVERHLDGAGIAVPDDWNPTATSEAPSAATFVVTGGQLPS